METGSGDLCPPRVELLEEVVRRATRLAAVRPEPDLVHPDVEHGRLGGRSQLLEKQSKLAPARAQRDGVDEVHAGDGSGRAAAGRGQRRARVGWRLVVEAVVRPVGPYRLGLISRRGSWSAPLPDGGAYRGVAAPRRRGRRPGTRRSGHRAARFMLALDDDTGEFHRRFARDPLLGPAARALLGWRPHAACNGRARGAPCGLRPADRVATRPRDRARDTPGVRAEGRDAGRAARLSPARLCACDLSASRAATLARLCGTVDLERLQAATRRRRSQPGSARERGIGPWSIGVIALEGLGRYDAGLVGDLGLIKLVSALRGHRAEAWETAELLAPYGEWQGLAGELLLLGWTSGLVPGADPDIARRIRLRARKAA